MLLTVISIITIINLNGKKEIKLDNVQLKEEVSNMNGLAIMLQQDDGIYKESTERTFPTNMKYNEELSGCIDNVRNKIANALTFTNGTARVETNNTSYCYLYFDIPPINAETLPDNVETTTNGYLWDSTITGDGYRYVGTNPNNYVCFGTTNRDTCINDTDKYMYRIIGIFEDSEGNSHLKLIKKEALNTSYMWNQDYENDVAWEASDLYKRINGSYFLTNTTYSYMQNTTWTEKIEEWTYTATNTQTYNIGSSTSNVGANYYSSWPIGIYNSEHEIDTTTGCYSSSESAINCKTTATYTHPQSKIGLMYASDYALSLGETAVTMQGSVNTNGTTLKKGWMHLSNNDSSAPNSFEWTISRYGAHSNGIYRAWYVHSSGYVYRNDVYYAISVRPVFYLKSNVELIGEGTTANPYIVK